MPNPDIKELRRLAEAATPGPWEWGVPDYGEEHNPPDECAAASLNAAESLVLNGCGNCANIFFKDVDGRFIVAANPSTILSLLDRLEAAETSGYKSGIEDAAKVVIRRNKKMGERESVARIADAIRKLEPKS
jgi:hypothetical protein